MHPTVVELLFRRAAAFVVALTLGAAGWVECAGWQATPEARMACCSDGNVCPMHGSPEPGSGSRRVVTQAQADTCCAASDADDSTPSAGAFSLSLSAALVTSPLATTLAPVTTRALLDAWCAQVPLPGAHVPKHVLLSVFLI